jgi:hypothetical protein
MRVKQGVSFDHASAELMHGIAVVEECFRKYGEESRVTHCFSSGPWSVTLLHGIERDARRAARAGQVDACDFGYPPPEKSTLIIAAIKGRLSKTFGGKFDVLDELTSAAATAAGVGSQWSGAHLHIEFDP